MDRSSAAQIRSQAVENVDARHGYTVEFSSTPGQHAAEYDEEEARLFGYLRDSCSAGGPAWLMWNNKAKAARGS